METSFKMPESSKLFPIPVQSDSAPAHAKMPNTTISAWKPQPEYNAPTSWNWGAGDLIIHEGKVGCSIRKQVSVPGLIPAPQEFIPLYGTERGINSNGSNPDIIWVVWLHVTIGAKHPLCKVSTEPSRHGSCFQPPRIQGDWKTDLWRLNLWVWIQHHHWTPSWNATVGE